MRPYARYETTRPEWMRSVPRTKPKADEPGQLYTPTERQAEDDIREGSDYLLAAIWVNHPGIMRHAIARGRSVEIPGWAKCK